LRLLFLDVSAGLNQLSLFYVCPLHSLVQKKSTAEISCSRSYKSFNVIEELSIVVYCSNF